LGRYRRLIAFGNETYDILQKNLRDEFQIFKVTHYSHYISKEKYREQILESLKLSLFGGLKTPYSQNAIARGCVRTMHNE
jgi:hypothetical protein